jgi:hypothetical protein
VFFQKAITNDNLCAVSCVCKTAVEIKGPKDQTQWQNHLNLNQQETMTQEQEFHALHSLLITNTSIKEKGAI